MNVAVITISTFSNFDAEAIMTWTMHMDTLECLKDGHDDTEPLQVMSSSRSSTEKQAIPVDLTVADIDAFLRRMYPLQQC